MKREKTKINLNYNYLCIINEGKKKKSFEMARIDWRKFNYKEDDNTKRKLYNIAC